MIQEINAEDRSIAFMLFGFLFACYLLTYTGHIQSSDGLAMFATTESIVRRGEVDINQLLWMDFQQGSYGPDGELYSRKGLGMTMLALPLVWLARTWPNLGLVHAALLLNPLLTAWTGVLLYRSGRRLEWHRRAAIILSLAFGLATLAWPYSQTFFSDPVASWGLFGAFYGLLTFRQTGRKRYLLLAGLAWGLAYLARAINLITLPIYLVGLVVVMYRQARAWSGRTQSTMLVSLIVRNWRPIASFLIPVVIAGLLSLWWNWLRYGSIWETGYADSEQFSATWLFGIGGLLVGPARGLIWYSPIVLLAILGIRWFWQNKPWILGVAIANSLVYILVYGKWYMWHGGFSWGPRFMLPLLPFLILLSGPVFARLWTPGSHLQRRHVWQRLTALFILLSVGIQWLGILVPFGMVQDLLASTVQPLFAEQTFTQVQYSPLMLQWQFLGGANVPFAWWRLNNQASQIDWLSLAAIVVGLFLGLLLIYRQWQHVDRVAAVQVSTRRQWVNIRLNWLYGPFILLLALALLLRYQATTTMADERKIAQRIHAEEQTGDAILHLMPQETQRFANVYHGSLPVYGLFQNSTLDEDDIAWFNHLTMRYRRLWVVPDTLLPEASGWEQPLRAREYLLLDERNGRRLALYALSPSYSLVVTGLGTIFGYQDAGNEPVTTETGWTNLRGYSLTPKAAPGEEILIALHWEVLRRVDQNYHVFVHLLNEDGEKLAQRDGQPVQWMRPTRSWQPGEEIDDHYAMLLDDDLSPGSYTISVGLYDPVSGERLPVSAGPGDYAIQLGPIEVERK